jgi:hypothetical protein
MSGSPSRLMLMDEQKLLLVRDTYNRITTSVIALVKRFEALPKAEQDPLLALMLSRIEATPRLIGLYLTQQSLYNEILSVRGSDHTLVKLIYIRFIHPKRLILLAMQRILVELEHALQDAPVDPKERDAFLAEEGGRVTIEGIGKGFGLPPQEQEELARAVTDASHSMMDMLRAMKLTPEQAQAALEEELKAREKLAEDGD